MDEKKGKAAGVKVLDTKTNEVIEFYSRILFLNASTVQLLLATLSLCFNLHSLWYSKILSLIPL